jgi:MFS family permease
VTVETRRREPVLDVRFFRSVPFSGASVIAVAAFASLGGFLFLNTLYLQDARGYSALHAGLLTVPMAVMIAVFASLSGRLVGRRGPRLPFAAAGLALAIGALLLARLTPHTPLAYLLVAYVVFGVGSGLVTAPITNTAVSGMPAEQAGVAGAVASTSRQIGASLGVAVTGSIVALDSGAGVHRRRVHRGQSRRLGRHRRLRGGRAPGRAAVDRALGAGHRPAQRAAAGPAGAGGGSR